MSVAPLDRPLTGPQILQDQLPDGTVSGVVRVRLDALVAGDQEATLDLLSTLLTGSPLLLGITYAVVGMDDDDDLLVRVSGDPTEVLADLDADTGGVVV